MGFFDNRPIAYIVEMENKTDKNGKNTSFVEILAVLRCDFTILFRALSFSLDFIRFVHSRGIHSFTFSGGRAKCINHVNFTVVITRYPLALAASLGIILGVGPSILYSSMDTLLI